MLPMEGKEGERGREREGAEEESCLWASESAISIDCTQRGAGNAFNICCCLASEYDPGGVA